MKDSPVTPAEAGVQLHLRPTLPGFAEREDRGQSGSRIALTRVRETSSETWVKDPSAKTHPSGCSPKITSITSATGSSNTPPFAAFHSAEPSLKVAVSAVRDFSPRVRGECPEKARGGIPALLTFPPPAASPPPPPQAVEETGMALAYAGRAAHPGQGDDIGSLSLKLKQRRILLTNRHLRLHSIQYDWAHNMKLIPWEPDILSLVQRIDAEDIDLQPEFQRQEIWSRTKKRKLIDTVLRNWSIPPIHLVVTEDSKLEVLDGQQRLASLRDFVHNKFSVDGSVQPEDLDIRKLNRKFYRQLDPNVRRAFDHYSIRCFKITDYTPEEPSELFYRLNQPAILTAGEQRNALYGPAREQLKELVLFFELQGNNKSTIGFSNTRLAYDDVIARVLYFKERGAFSVKGTEARISDRFRSRQQFSEDVIESTKKAISLFSESRQLSPFSKYNKATLLSWLIFFLRWNDKKPNLEFISIFHNDSDADDIFENHIFQAIDLFKDRASLRVTDVSSVVFRDFALYYSYYHLGNRELPNDVDVSVIVDVNEALSKSDDVYLEYILEELLPIEAWGELK